MPAAEFVPPRAYRSPSALSTLLELTAPGEMLGFRLGRAALRRLLPKGDGHPVLVIPAFMATDASTATLRRFLVELGYDAHPWGLGRNPGICENLNRRLQQRITELARTTGRRVSLIGWSAGGLFARVAGHQQAARVRQVITLGTPFGIDFGGNADGLIGRIQRLIQGDRHAPEPMIASGHIHRAPPVPSTSIISRRDGFANWKYSLDVGSTRNENVCVPASHAAMPQNPFVIALIAERLAQPDGAWKPFTPTRLTRRFFSRVCARDAIPEAVARDTARRAPRLPRDRRAERAAPAD